MIYYLIVEAGDYMYKILKDLKVKDQEFVEFFNAVEDNKNLTCGEALKKVDDVLSLIKKMNNDTYDFVSNSEIKDVLKERVLWKVERQSYYEMIDKIARSIRNSLPNNALLGEKYSILIQSVTTYDHLKSNFVFNSDLEKQIKVICALQDGINNFYKDINQKNECLIDKDSLLRRPIQGESDNDYRVYLQKFFDKNSKVKEELSKEVQFLKTRISGEDYSFTCWDGNIFLGDDPLFVRLRKHLPELFENFISFYENSNSLRLKFLRENAKYADAEQNNPQYFGKNKNIIQNQISNLTIEMQRNGDELSFISEMGVVSQLLQYMKLFDERKNKFQILGIKREIAADLQELKYKINQYFQILMKKHGKEVVLIYDDEIPRLRYENESSHDYLMYLRQFQFVFKDRFVYSSNLESFATQPLIKEDMSDSGMTVSSLKEDLVPFFEDPSLSTSSVMEPTSLEAEEIQVSNVEEEKKHPLIRERKEIIHSYLTHLNEMITEVNEKIKQITYMEGNTPVYLQKKDLDKLYFYGEEFEAISEEIERIQSISNDVIEDLSADFSIPRYVSVRELVRLRRDALLKQKTSQELRQEINTKIHEYEAKTGKIYVIQEKEGNVYRIVRRYSSSEFLFFQQNTNVVLEFENFVGRNSSRHEIEVGAQNENDFEVCIGDGFFISLNTLSIVFDQNNDYSYTKPFYAPDTERIIDAMIFYDVKTNSLHVSCVQDEADAMRAYGLKLIAVKAQDGMYRVEDIKKFHKVKKGKGI